MADKVGGLMNIPVYNRRKVHLCNLDGRVSVPEMKGNEGVLLTIITDDKVRICVYVDLIDMDVTLSTNMGEGKIISLPQP